MSVTLLSGCSYFSWMNPFSETEKEEKVYTAPQANPFLWRAALEKLDFMPISSQDANAGLIVTEWTGISGQGSEKFKLEVHVLSNALRSDCLKVVGFERSMENGNWVEEPMNPQMVNAIKKSILEQARVLYRKSLAN